MIDAKDCQSHVCKVCGAAWRERTRIVVEPIVGELKGLGVSVDASALPIVGYGHKLKRFVQADWVRSLGALLHDGDVFGFHPELGVVLIRAKNLKSVQQRLGDDFLSVEQGILVSLDASLVLNSHERMCGFAAGVADGRAAIKWWVTPSRRGMHRLRKRLGGASKRVA